MDEIDAKVDKKIAEAKLDVTEKRLSYTLWIAGAALALFGVMLPLLISFQSSNKVESAIDKMQSRLETFLDKADSKSLTQNQDNKNNIKESLEQNQSEVRNAVSQMKADYKELVGNQLRKPVLVCKYNNSDTLNQEIVLIGNKTSQSSLTINLVNIGDARATNIHIKFYLNKSADLPESSEITLEQLGSDWNLDKNDEKGFNSLFLTNSFVNLNAQEFYPISITGWGQKSFTEDAMIKIYSEQLSTPVVYRFKIKYDPK
jgi:hypothetical protein